MALERLSAGRSVTLLFPRGTLLVAVLGMAMTEPIIAEPDLFRYAFTQGGLLIVVLILLWSYRKDSLGALMFERERVSVLTDLVASTREASVRSADAIAVQAKSIDALARIVEKIDERRYGRDKGAVQG